MRYSILFVLWLLAFLPACHVARNLPAATAPATVILDTDIGPDYDDVGALALLHALADSGKCTLLATMASNKHPLIAPVLSVLNTYFNRPGLPVAVVRGNAVNLPAGQKWDSLVVADYPHKIKSNTDAADALMLYRKLLAAQPDTSVTIVTIGFFTNLANLLQSAPDAFSPATGLELVRKKVKQLVCMAGRFDGEMGRFKEFNVVQDAAAAKVVFDSWPTHIIFSGFEIGEQIHTGLPLVNNPYISHSPVKDVFARCIPMDANDAAGRMSWDETAVLVAVCGYEQYFGAVPGIIVGHADGTNGWDKTGQRDLYLVAKMPVAQLTALLDRLMMHQPR